MNVTEAAPLRRGRPLAVTALMALLASLFVALVASASPAHAAPYRFWGYYQLTDGEWAFAQTGSGESVPQDGDVEGWRFAVADVGDTRTPREVLSFEEICEGTDPVDGQKRVGLVVDYGREADAEEGEQPPEPTAQCVVADEQATGSEVLVAAGLELREEGGQICAVGGYPSQGCGGEVSDVSQEAAAADEPVSIPVSGSDASTPTDEAEGDQANDDGTEQATEDADTGNEEVTGTETEETGFAIGTVLGVVVVSVLLIAVIAFFVAQRRRRD